MIHEFIGDEPLEEFTDRCFRGILRHEFGVYFVKLICERLLDIEIGELTDLGEVREALYRFFSQIKEGLVEE